jgi:hypothetical protein
MKTYAPKGLRGEDLRGLLADLFATPAQVAKHLAVTERSVYRWLTDGTAPRAVLYALWHETPKGRHVSALDVGNELVIVKGLAQSLQSQTAKDHARLCRVLAISDTGAANDPLASGPAVVVAGQHGVNAFVGLVGGIVGAGRSFVKSCEVGPDGGVTAEPGPHGDDDLQHEFRGEVHGRPLMASATAGAIFSTLLPMV